MGFMDTVKGWFGKAKEQAAAHDEQLMGGIDRAADAVDDKTGGKYSDQIEQGAEKAKDFIDDLDDEEG